MTAKIQDITNRLKAEIELTGHFQLGKQESLEYATAQIFWRLPPKCIIHFAICIYPLYLYSPDFPLPLYYQNLIRKK